MNKVSQRMQRRGGVVAALGALLAIVFQAFLTDATLSGRPERSSLATRSRLAPLRRPNRKVRVASLS
jgi:hypothetical protein